MKKRLPSLQERVNVRVQGAEAVAQTGQVELLAPLLDGLAHRRAETAAFVAEQGEQAHRRPAQVLGRVEKGGHVDGGEDQRQADDQSPPAARPPATG